MKKIDYKLTKEEQEILDAFERGELVTIPNFEAEKKRFAQIARDTLAKKKNINIRIAAKTLDKLKAKAAEEGLPYQTLASSILHKYVNK